MDIKGTNGTEERDRNEGPPAVPLAKAGKSPERKAADRETYRLAHRIARYMAERSDGDCEEPSTWLRFAAERGWPVVAYNSPGGPLGSFTPSMEEEGGGLITYNVCAPPDKQARVLVHEIAHAILYPQCQNAVLGENPVNGYDDAMSGRHHRIAREAERVVFKERE